VGSAIGTGMEPWIVSYSRVAQGAAQTPEGLVVPRYQDNWMVGGAVGIAGRDGRMAVANRLRRRTAVEDIHQRSLQHRHLRVEHRDIHLGARAGFDALVKGSFNAGQTEHPAEVIDD